MPKAVKIIAAIIGAVVVLIVLAAIILPLVIDPNEYRDQIETAVEDRAGRPMSIEGDLSLSVFPWLGVEIDRVRLGNPEGFGDEPFAAVESAGVSVKLLPLLGRRLEVSTVRLEGLRLNLERLADGRTNWEDLAEAEPDTVEPAPEDDATFTFGGVEGLRLEDAVVRLRDREADEVVEIVIPSLTTGKLAPGSTFPVEAQALVTLAEQNARLDTRFRGDVTLAEDLSGARAANVTLKVEAAGDPVPGGSATAELEIPALVFELEQMTGTLESLTLTGTGKAAGGRQSLRVASPAVRFDLDAPAADFEKLELRVDGEGGGLPDGGVTATINAPSLSVDLAAQTLSLPSFAAEAAGVALQGELQGERIVDAPRLAGRLSVAEFSPRELLERLGQDVPPTADGDVLGRASLETRVVAGSGEMSLTGLTAVLDDTHLEGEATVGTGEVTRVRAKVEVDEIDLDRYLPPEAEEATPAESAEAADAELEFDWLQGLDLDASVALGRAKVSGITMTDITARAIARDGVLTVEPLAAALYGGRVQGSARLDARESPATFNVKQSLQSLDLLPFVSDLADFNQLDGTASFNADLTTSAASTAGLLKGLNGDLDFDVTDGVYKGVNVWWEIQRAWAIIKRRDVPEKPSSDTDFRDLKGSAVIRDGVVENDSLQAGLPFLALAGKGRVNLVESALNYRLDATVVRPAEGQASGAAEELAGVTIPLGLSGSLDAPKVDVDLADIVKRQASQAVLEKLGVEGEAGKSGEESAKEAAKKKAEEKVRGKWKDLFGD